MRILLAVSGGRDSMYLANRASEFFPGASFAVAHCNFHLRGEESDRDARFVQEWCSKHGIECHTADFDTVSISKERGISIEMAARELRYAWFSELCSGQAGGGGGFDAVAVAHNANDNAETMLLNMLRGTGAKGLCGMEECSQRGGLKILRPMLKTGRDEISEWMRAGGHEWRDDSSNSENDCKRNIIRNVIFPVFKKINPSFVQTLNDDMSRLRQTERIADGYFREAEKRIRLEDGFSIKALMEEEHWRYILWRLLEHTGISKPTFDKLAVLLEKFKSNPPGTVTLGGKVFETPDYDISLVRKRIVVNPKKNLGLSR